MTLLIIGLLSIIIFIFFTIGLKKVSSLKSIFIFELGYFYPLLIVISTIFAVVPLYVTKSLDLPPIDNRFWSGEFDYKSAEIVGYQYLLYLISFCGFYVYLRRGYNSSRGNSNSKIYVSNIARIFIVLVYLCFELYLVSIRNIYKIKAEGYADTYIMYKSIPLFLQQITGIVNGSIYVVKIMLLVVFFQDYKKYKILIWFFIGFNFIETLIVLGERTNLIILLITYCILYHNLVKFIPMKRFIYMIIFGGIFVTLLGEIRMVSGDLSSIAESSISDEGFSGGEFEFVFLNSVDIYNRKKQEFINTPISLYFSGLVSLIPQQLLLFEKTTYADWYVGTFYPAAKERGNGFAFGVVAESMVGFGQIQLIFHAFLLAFIFAKLHIKYLKANISIQFYCFYIWITLFSYYSFRFNTFNLVPLIFFHFLPVNLIFGLINFKNPIKNNII